MLVEQTNVQTAEQIDPSRLKHAKWEDDYSHACLKAKIEVVNKTKGDEEHTFLVTQYKDELTILVFAQNMNNSEGKAIYSRGYLVSLHTTIEAHQERV